MGIAYQIPVVLAKDLIRGWALLGDLGVLGVGVMWQPITDYIRSLPTYHEAPLRACEEDF